MTDWQITRLCNVLPQPWRNGGGVTRELLAWPTANDWSLRLSVADIEQDGPFSSFPGLQRWFVVLEGDGVELTIDGVRHPQRIGDPALTFDGAAAVSCRLLSGPTRDLNLMLKSCDGGLVRAQAGLRWQPPTARWGLFAMQAGRLITGVEVEQDQSSDAPLARASTSTSARRTIDFPARSLVHAGTCVADVTFQPTASGATASAWWWWASDPDSP